MPKKWTLMCLITSFAVLNIFSEPWLGVIIEPQQLNIYFYSIDKYTKYTQWKKESHRFALTRGWINDDNIYFRVNCLFKDSLISHKYKRTQWLAHMHTLHIFVQTLLLKTKELNASAHTDLWHWRFDYGLALRHKPAWILKLESVENVVNCTSVPAFTSFNLSRSNTRTSLGQMFAHVCDCIASRTFRRVKYVLDIKIIDTESETEFQK